ncbi:MAG: DegT/DnrJ/EryC1/StrS family aminotransferase [Deltaproteobacteria bacterium]|jgi:dTDP-4-amino-4,6-dideoxygalactose transaminase|nr:DegT/DnrJ/EryC1/StrS family aminotransferase [Deltaproteobacteria bacterium]
MEVPILKIPFDAEDAQVIGQELSQMLLSGRLAMGEKCQQFENVFAKFVGVKRVVGCQNGTAALEMIARALKLADGSVVVPALTFMATALAPIAVGAKVIVADVDPHSFQLDPDELRLKTLPNTRAVILVHLGGFISQKLSAIQSWAQSQNISLVEDAAHAHGAEIDGHKAGTLGVAAAFSFYPTKVLTTAEGGAVTTNDETLFRDLLAIRQHGQAQPGSNIHQTFGLNYRPSEIHALLGLRMMAKADWILAQRREAAAIYDRLLANSPLKVVRAGATEKPAYYKYMALLPEKVNRLAIKDRLKKEFGVSLAGEVYATSLTDQPFFQNHPEVLAAPLTPCPVAEMVAQRQICLPIWPGLTVEAQEYVVDCLLKVL